MLYWAAPTLLNPHLAVVPKDFESSQLFYEPLADIDTDGDIVPVLPAETPSVTNGGVAPDGTWVQWCLKRGVTWHDGRPFTADDVIFTWQYAAEVATAATSAGSYQGIDRIERIDDYTVKLAFKRPTPYWADAFCSAAGMVLPRCGGWCIGHAKPETVPGSSVVRRRPVKGGLGRGRGRELIPPMIALDFLCLGFGQIVRRAGPWLRRLVFLGWPLEETRLLTRDDVIRKHRKESSRWMQKALWCRPAAGRS
jgi:hypothetical protein